MFLSSLSRCAFGPILGPIFLFVLTAAALEEFSVHREDSKRNELHAAAQGVSLRILSPGWLDPVCEDVATIEFQLHIPYPDTVAPRSQNRSFHLQIRLLDQRGDSSIRTDQSFDAAMMMSPRNFSIQVGSPALAWIQHVTGSILVGDDVVGSAETTYRRTSDCDDPLLDLEEAEGHRRRFKYRNTLREQALWSATMREYQHGTNAVHYHTYMGYKALRFPFDAWRVQEIIFKERPDVFVECGCSHGGSTLFWATMMEAAHPHGDPLVITVDLEARPNPTEGMPPIVETELWRRRVVGLFGKSSIDPQVHAEIARRTAGRRTMVLLDSNHRYEHVKREIELYSPMVSQGSYLVIEDTGIVLTYAPGVGGSRWSQGTVDWLGPLEAVEEWMTSAEYARDWEWDQKLEVSTWLTNNVLGWHRRKTTTMMAG